jgi:hypothetical protein
MKLCYNGLRQNGLPDNTYLLFNPGQQSSSCKLIRLQRTGLHKMFKTVAVRYKEALQYQVLMDESQVVLSIT